MPRSAPDPAALETALLSSRLLPPVDRWAPPLLGEMDLRIARDGTWYHQGQPIQRETLVRLFASILRCEEDGQHYLVTPVEKWRIRIDDAPFVAIRVDATETATGQRLTFTTNVGDSITAGPEHPLTVVYATPDGEPTPYLHVRGRLRALLSRAVFLELAALGEEQRSDGCRNYGVWSNGQFFWLGCLDEED